MSSIAYDRDRRLGTVEGKIRKVFLRSIADKAEYFFCDWYQANKLLDKVERPAVIYLLPPSGTLNFGRRQVIDRPETMIVFACASQFDFDGEENDGTIEEMKRLAARFVLAYNDCGLFEPLEGEISYRVLYNEGDHNVTGVLLALRIKEKEGILLCDGSLARRRFHGYRHVDSDDESDVESDETATDESSEETEQAEDASQEDSQGSESSQEESGATYPSGEETPSEGSAEDDSGIGQEDAADTEHDTNEESNNDESSLKENVSEGETAEKGEEDEGR